ncbi:redoxin domain-containing protein [Prolixibacteraceae bacterium Z1-6]|uniref:Redoxin domain-containing protein n=1 Tax=Draconibacterium aestuarii TaxID=2998507 RepID=A0A9X3F4S1_9BACT|nr:redoxin domain-containing protein [Prolixibacteraceae bacterium Z1-6]
MRYLLFLFLFCLLPFADFATTIRCSNAEYAEKELHFYKLSDPISGEEELVFTLKFDAAGTCAAEIKNTQTVYTFCEFGVYRGMLFLEPGKTIDLRLPPFREKSFANEKNPYFQPVSFWFISETKDQLNDKISAFEQELNRLTDKQFNQLYFKQSKTVYDSVQMQLNTAFPETTPEAFVNHKKLEVALTKADIFRLRPEDYSEIFDKIKPEYWTHQAFTTAFEKTFDRQLSFSAKAIHGKEVNTAVLKQDIQALLSFTKTKYKVSGDMAELVLLKLLHDGFYSGDFPKAAIKNMVNSDLFIKNSNQTIRTAAKNISTKFSFLQPGEPAPKICLTALSGKQSCTNNTASKFKYIVFADVETVVCQEHLKYLSRVNELFNKHLEIFVVMRDTGDEGIKKFFNEHEVPGTKMIDKANKYVERYEIRSFPQCFLLNEKHNVVFSDTKAPLDGFEQQFGAYLQKELFMRQRNQTR